MTRPVAWNAIEISMVIASLMFGTSALPVANADDPLAPIITSVINYRAATGCPRLTYNQSLEDAAQKYARSEVRLDGAARDYPGSTGPFLGSGDPQAAAINSAYRNGAAAEIKNCDDTDFGVGFVRHDDRSVDVVTIVFGVRSDETLGPPVPAATSTPAAPTMCPVGSPTPNVPAGQTCAPVPAPTDKVSLSFAKGLQWTVTVTNAADIAGKCTYVATNPILPGSNKSFDIAPRGSASFTVLAPPPLSTYHVVVSCTGTFNGSDVVFGHVEQDVSA